MTRTMTVSTSVEIDIVDDMIPDTLRDFQARHHNIEKIGDVFERIAVGASKGHFPNGKDRGITARIIRTDIDEYI